LWAFGGGKGFWDGVAWDEIEIIIKIITKNNNNNT